MQAKKWDHIFKAKLSGHETIVTSEAWSRMEEMLDSGTQPKTKALIWRWAVACLAIIFVASALYISIKSDPQSRLEIATVEDVLEPTANNISMEELPIEMNDEQDFEKNKSVVRKPKVAQQATKGEPITVTQENFLAVDEDSLEAGETLIADQTMENSPKKRMPIRITYKKGNPPIQKESMVAQAEPDSLKNGKIKQFFENAREDIENSTLWADVKNVKEKVIKNSKE